MVMELKDILLAVGNLPDVSLGRLMSCADEMHCRKGSMIIEAHWSSRMFSLLEKG